MKINNLNIPNYMVLNLTNNSSMFVDSVNGMPMSASYNIQIYGNNGRGLLFDKKKGVNIASFNKSQLKLVPGKKNP